MTSKDNISLGLTFKSFQIKIQTQQLLVFILILFRQTLQLAIQLKIHVLVSHICSQLISKSWSLCPLNYSHMTYFTGGHSLKNSRIGFISNFHALVFVLF